MAARFAHEAAPALLNLADPRPAFLNGIRAARERIVARTDEDRSEFLRRRGFSKAETGKIIDTVLAEEGRPPESVFDFVQGITAVARDKPHQDARLDMEAKAKKLMDRAADFRKAGHAIFRISGFASLLFVSDFPRRGPPQVRGRVFYYGPVAKHQHQHQQRDCRT
jgi:hypothetical protein